MKLSQEVINVLSDCTITENKLFLPNTQLDRKLYLLVDKALKSLGGKWNRKEKAHLFDNDINESIEQLIQTGEYVDVKKEFQFFKTPEELAKKLVDISNISDGETVLEPSAGTGNIASLIPNCDVIELNETNRQFLKDNGFNLIHDDFLSFDKPYDVIVGNPPFSKQQDIEHVTRMIKLAKKTVVSIMSASVLFRNNKKTVEFRELVEKYNGTFEELPAGSFKESGTMVNACIVVINKEERS